MNKVSNSSLNDIMDPLSSKYDPAVKAMRLRIAMALDLLFAHDDKDILINQYKALAGSKNPRVINEIILLLNTHNN